MPQHNALKHSATLALLSFSFSSKTETGKENAQCFIYVNYGKANQDWDFRGIGTFTEYPSLPFTLCSAFCTESYTFIAKTFNKINMV